MSSTLFEVVEHSIPCQHIREYPRATKSRQEEVLHLSINQYKPLKTANSCEDGVTIIAAHANGIPKEAYEPLWDDILRASTEHGVNIKGIWIADQSNQGASGVLNETVQGDDPSGFDHSRDLLHMVNTFREQMPRPIVGIGHSMGAMELVGLSIMHPRLFTTLVLMEPMLQQDVPPGANFAMPSTYRADVWPSFAAAEAAFRKSKFFATFDSRVLDNLVRYGLREVPTAVYPLSATVPEKAVTLKTSKHQEVWSYLRPNFTPRRKASSEPGFVPTREERLLAPDVDYQHQGTYNFGRHDMVVAFEYLPFLRPSAFYMFGGKSPMSSPELQVTKVDRTGVGLGGNGGVGQGGVEKHVFENWGHMFPCEHVADTARTVVQWLARELRQFEQDEKFLKSHPSGGSNRDMTVVSEQWMKLVRLPGNTQRPLKEKL